MTYAINGLDPAPYAPLFGLDDEQLAARGVVRMTVDNPNFPCRVSLRDADIGDEVLLLNHVSHEGANPYRASHAIFVSRSAKEAATYVDTIPPALDRRILSLRAFDADGMMVDAALAQPGEADAVIRKLLANPAADHIDAHNATRGCFAARIKRN
jgi:hypothetical protein